MDFRKNRNETNRNKNITQTGNGKTCNSLCQNNTCASPNPFIPERDTYLVNRIEEENTNESINSTTVRNFMRHNTENDELFPTFIQRNAGNRPDFRATQITRIQTTIMDAEDEEEDECDCPNDTNAQHNKRLSWPTANLTVNNPVDSMILRPNLSSDRREQLPNFNENDEFNASVPFVPKRGHMNKMCDSGEPCANIGYMREFGRLVSTQLDNLETRFIVYKVKIRGSKSLGAILWRKKYLLLSIPLVLLLLWLILLLGVLIGSAFCSGMEECPWAKGTKMAPRFLYSPHNVF